MLNQVSASRNVSFGVAYHIQGDKLGTATEGLAKHFNLTAKDVYLSGRLKPDQSEIVPAIAVPSKGNRPGLVATGAEYNRLNDAKDNPKKFNAAVREMTGPQYPNKVDLGGKGAYDRSTGDGHEIDFTKAFEHEQARNEVTKIFGGVMYRGYTPTTVLYGDSGSVAYRQ